LKKSKNNLKFYRKENIDDDKDKVSGNVLSDEDLKIMSDLTKRMNEAEKTISKLVTNSFDLSKMKEDCMKLESELTQKTNKKDFFELHDKVNVQATIGNNMRDMIDRIQDVSNKNMKDLSFFLKKIESLSATVLAMKEALETLSGMKQDNILDSNQFLDVSSFQEYIKKYSKDKDKFDEIRRLFKDMAEAFNKKADGEDMRNFELPYYCHYLFLFQLF
jgi:ACT domain-containing protein